MTILDGQIQPLREDLLKVGPLVVGDREPSRIPVSAFDDHVVPKCGLQKQIFAMQICETIDKKDNTKRTVNNQITLITKIQFFCNPK